MILGLLLCEANVQMTSVATVLYNQVHLKPCIIQAGASRLCLHDRQPNLRWCAGRCEHRL